MMLAAVLLAACPPLQPLPGAPGEPRVVPAVAAEALALNAEGKRLYRQGHWPEARARYGAALVADPAFLAPALNRACALCREERFAEAASEAAALVRKAFVPWGREVLEAADLAPLHDRPEMGQVRAALAAGAAAWSASLTGSLLFVARTHPALRSDGQGVLVLGLGQEIYAWNPASGRYRQVTADDGRVLAFGRSGDGRTVVYVRGDKLVRQAGAPDALRGLSVRRLDLSTMALGPAVPLAGDVTGVDLDMTRGAVDLRVATAAGSHVFRLVAEALLPISAGAPVAGVHLGTSGTGPHSRVLHSDGGGCRIRAVDGPGGEVPAIQVTAAGRFLRLDARFGAGLDGLPFPAAHK